MPTDFPWNLSDEEFLMKTAGIDLTPVLEVVALVLQGHATVSTEAASATQDETAYQISTEVQTTGNKVA